MTKKTGRGGATPYYYIHARRGRRREGGDAEGRRRGAEGTAALPQSTRQGGREGLRRYRSLRNLREGGGGKEGGGRKGDRMARKGGKKRGKVLKELNN